MRHHINNNNSSSETKNKNTQPHKPESVDRMMTGILNTLMRQWRLQHKGYMSAAGKKHREKRRVAALAAKVAGAEPA